MNVHRVVAVASLVVMASLSLARTGEAQSSTAVSSADSVAIRNALDFLMSGNRVGAADAGFKLSRVGYWQPAALSPHLSEHALTFGDVNVKDTLWHVSVSQVLREVQTRRGRSFAALGYLAYIYAQPYPQYSQLRFRRNGNAMLVNVGDVHQLVFTLERGTWRLAAVRLVQWQGE